MSNRNCEMRNALEFGDVSLIAKIGMLLSQGAALLASLSRDEPVEVVIDEFCDRRGRCETPVCGSELCHCASFQSRESGMDVASSVPVTVDFVPGRCRIDNANLHFPHPVAGCALCVSKAAQACCTT